MKRKDRDNNWIDSHAIKLKVKANTLPASIFIYKWKFLLDRYTAVPMQCFFCQRIGHTSRSCKSKKPRCMICGEES